MVEGCGPGMTARVAVTERGSVIAMRCEGPKAGEVKWGHLTTRSQRVALAVTTEKVLVTASAWSLANHKGGWWN